MTVRPHGFARRPRAPRASRASGLTFPELLMSVAILGIVMASFAGVVDGANRSFRHTRDLAKAIAIAEALTEQLLIMDASDPALAWGPDHGASYDRDGYLAANPADTYFQAAWTVTPHQTVPNIRRIDIQVTWSEGGTPRVVGWFTFRN